MAGIRLYVFIFRLVIKELMIFVSQSSGNLFQKHFPVAPIYNIHIKFLFADARPRLL